MDVKDAINKRRSVRAFLDKEVDIEIVKTILETSKRAPSGVNSQPWKVYVLMGEAKNNLVKEACEKFDKGEMEKSFIKFTQKKDQIGIRLDREVQVSHCMERLVLAKMIWISGLLRQKRIMNSLVHQLGYS